MPRSHKETDSGANVIERSHEERALVPAHSPQKARDCLRVFVCGIQSRLTERRPPVSAKDKRRDTGIVFFALAAPRLC
jgi:hypothetical protein